MNGDTEAQEAQSDFDKSSTIPRNSEISQSYRRMFQAKRPASTAGLPSTQAPYPAGQPMYPGGPYPAAAGLPSPQAPYPSGQPMYPGGPYPSTPVHSTAAAGGYPPTPTGDFLTDVVSL